MERNLHQHMARESEVMERHTRELAALQRRLLDQEVGNTQLRNMLNEKAKAVRLWST